MKFASLVFVAICMMSSIHNGYAIRCYYCNNTVACADEMSSSVPSHECIYPDFPTIGGQIPSNITFTETKASFHCLKFITKYQGVLYYSRGCSKTQCSNIVSTNSSLTLEDCTECTSDECNASTAVSVSVFLFSLLLVFSIFKLA